LPLAAAAVAAESDIALAMPLSAPPDASVIVPPTAEMSRPTPPIVLHPARINTLRQSAKNA
jgi:hypothetical protein